MTDVNVDSGLVSGMIDKKLISITGKKHLTRVYFDGQLIDGDRHTFTSDLTAGCEALDVYFWNRFPSFKEIQSMRDLKGEHGARWLYMRWTERGQMRTKKQKKKVVKPRMNVEVLDSESEISSSDIESCSEREIKIKA